jgi:hypothetical protein
VADGTNTTSNDTPGQGNVSDGTPAGTGAPAPNGQNDNGTQRPASTQSHDTPGGQGFDLSKLTDRLDALPESIANAVKELIPQTAPQTQPTASTSDNSSNSAGNGSAGNSADGASASTSDSSQSAITKASRSERFASWWFGK